MTTDAFRAEWASWHEARERATASPLGLASLVATHWLAAAPLEFEGVFGHWHAAPDGIVGVGDELDGLTLLQGGRPIDAISGGHVVLTAGQEIEWGEKRLRYFERDGALALRLLDPAAPKRLAIRGIDSFEPDESWVIDGRFTPAAADETLEIIAIDGHVSEDRPTGTVELDLPGGPVTITVTAARGGLHAVFADGTSGGESYRFRFIDFPQPEESGAVTVGFNRAYLPPCVFSDFYVCPLPPSGNRLALPIRAGEKNLLVDEAFAA